MFTVCVCLCFAVLVVLVCGFALRYYFVCYFDGFVAWLLVVTGGGFYCLLCLFVLLSLLTCDVLFCVCFGLRLCCV